MPESDKPRKPSTTSSPKPKGPKGPSPRWLVYAMLTCFLLGGLWIVVYYLAPNNALMDPLGAWNLLVGFGLVVVGMGLATQWR